MVLDIAIRADRSEVAFTSEANEGPIDAVDAALPSSPFDEKKGAYVLSS
jgi:hypothetical protein